MTGHSPEVRRYRFLGVAAVAHAALLFGTISFVMGPEVSSWALRLWVGLATLWFFWPIILALHAGSSRRRAYASVGVAAAIVALPIFAYCSILARKFFFEMR